MVTFYCLLPSFLQIHNSDLCIFIYYSFIFLFILYQAKSHTMDVLMLNRYYYYYYYYYMVSEGNSPIKSLKSAVNYP